MRAEELRIGNFVTDEFYDTFKKEIIVDSINQEGINLTAGDNGKPYGMHQGTIEVEYEFEKLRGIPLTEDWLNRFGFTLVEQSPFETITLKYWVKNRICLFFNESPPENTWLVGWADQRFGKYSVATGEWITDVHTIQNIFHALTGTELKLN